MVGGVEQSFIAMELIEGPQLTTFADREGLDHQERIRLVVEVCDALDHAHSAGVIHRDLKPSNLLVGCDGRVKIIDFGIARAPLDAEETLSALTRSGELLGTASYMSPEQALGARGVIDVRTDVYSLGVILYELLTGALPLSTEGSSVSDFLRRIVEEPPRPPSRLGPHLRGDLDRVCLKALEKEPRDRYQSAGALAEDLRRYLEGKPVEASAPSRVRRLVSWSRRRPGRAVALVVAVMIGLLLLGYATANALGAREFARTLNQRWRTGDFAMIGREVSTLPRWVGDLWLDADLVRLRDELLGEVVNSPEAEVVRLAASGAEEDALLSAAGYLEREGLAPNPSLGRYLGAVLAGEVGGDRVRAGELLGRLFNERPDVSPEDRSASAELRRGLHELLMGERDLASQRHVPTILGGCGDETSVGVLCKWMAIRAATDDPERGDELRTAICAVGEIVRRSEVCGYRTEILKFDWARVWKAIDEAARKVQPMRGASPNLRHAASNLAIRIALAHRSRVVPVPRMAPTCFGSWPPSSVAAAIASEDVRRLLEGPTVALSLMTGYSLGDSRFYFDYGYLVGLAVLPESEGRILGEVRDLAEDNKAGDVGEPCYRAGLQQARSMWEGRRLSEIDPAQRLGALRSATDEPFDLVASAMREELPRGFVAAWFLSAPEVERAGCATGIEWRAASPAARFDGGHLGVRLGGPGVSAIRLAFDYRGRTASDLSLYLDCQREYRPELPGGGEAELELSIDGIPIASGIVPRLTSRGLLLAVPLPDDRQRGEHEFTIALAAHSTVPVTVRLIALVPEENWNGRDPGMLPLLMPVLEPVAPRLPARPKCVSLTGGVPVTAALLGPGSSRGSDGPPWVQRSRWSAAIPEEQAQFGGALAISEGTAIVGAMTADCAEIRDTGAAFVFERRDERWTQEQVLHAPAGWAEDHFGSQVAIDGDTLVVTAPGDDAASPDFLHCDSGAAYVFVRNGPSWTPEQKLVADDCACSVEAGPTGLGGCAAIEGNTIVLGCEDDDSPLSGGTGRISGSAYVFERKNGIWTQVAKLTSEHVRDRDMLGASVDIEGEWILVGAPHNQGSPGQGAVYAYRRPAGGWESTSREDCRITAGTQHDDDEFGRVLAVDEGTLVVGASYHDRDGLAWVGAAWVFERSASGWREVAELRASDGEAGDRFGTKVAIEGSRIVVAATYHRVAGSSGSGVAYVFDRPASGWVDAVEDFEIRDGSPVPAAHYAQALAVSGGSVFVGSRGHEQDGLERAGAVFELEPAGSVDTFCHANNAASSCPCGNGIEGLGGCGNSTGRGARLDALGSPGVLDASLVLSLSGLPAGVPCVLLEGSGTAARPFGDGLLCLHLDRWRGTVRLPVFDSGVHGIVELSGIVGPIEDAGKNVASSPAGESRHYQVWYRDPLGPCGEGWSLSNALRLSWGP